MYDGRITLQERYRKSQLDLLEAKEGKYQNSPKPQTVGIAVLATVAEPLGVLWLLWPAGWTIALFGAFFPVALVWTMAAFMANRVEVPREQDKSVEAYSHDVG